MRNREAWTAMHTQSIELRRLRRRMSRRLRFELIQRHCDSVDCCSFLIDERRNMVNCQAVFQGTLTPSLLFSIQKKVTDRAD